MSAPLCRQCGGPCEPERHHYATPVCFACLAPPQPLRVIPTRDQLEAELTRLRAALASIAALQSERSVWDADTCKEVFDLASAALDGAE